MRIFLPALLPLAGCALLDGGAPTGACSVEQIDDGARITCADGSSAVVHDGADGADGSDGSDGADGSDGGSDGADVSAGASVGRGDIYVVTYSKETSGSHTTAYATCDDADDVLLSGGYRTSTSGTEVFISEPYQVDETDAPAGWYAEAVWADGGTLTVYAVCLGV